MTALEFMGWEIVENFQDTTSYFEKGDGSVGFIRAIPRKVWKRGQWIEEEDDWAHKFYMEEVMSRCPLSWREIEDFSSIQVVCGIDMDYDFFDQYPCYQIIGKAVSQVEIDGVGVRVSELCAFSKDGWEPEPEYTWNNCVADGHFFYFVDESGRVDPWWHGTDGILKGKGNLAYKRVDIRLLLYQWCHLLAACPGIDLLMGVADGYSYLRFREDDETELEKAFLENAKIGVKAGRGKVELVGPEEFRKLYKEYGRMGGKSGV